MRPVETIPVMARGEIKENHGAGREFNGDIFIIRTFVNVTTYP
jgi:hypothetical protein